MKKIKLITVLILIVLSSYSFAQWTYVGGVSGIGFYPSVSILDANFVFVAGGPSGTPIINKSSNGGVTFTNVGTAGINFELYCFWAQTASTFYAGDGGASGGSGGNARVYKTTNGGTSWTTIDQTGGLKGFINGVYFSRTHPLSGFVESDPPSGPGNIYWISKTNDGGNNWIYQSPPSAGVNTISGQNSLFIIDSLFYGFGTAFSISTPTPPKSIITSNGGVNWYNAELNGTPASSNTTSLAFNTNKLNGIGGCDNASNTIARTTDGGVTWFSQSIPSTVTGGNSFARYVPNTNTVYLIVSSSNYTQSFKSTNNGANWTSLTWPAGYNKVTSIDLIYSGGNTVLYSVCFDGVSVGYVCKLVEPVIGINLNEKQIPNEYKLNQNFPNPFNPNTNITYELPKNGFIKLSVLDVLGREIETLVNEEKTAGTYEATFNASQYSSGVYFYSLTTDGFNETKKMILLK